MQRPNYQESSHDAPGPSSPLQGDAAPLGRLSNPAEPPLRGTVLAGWHQGRRVERPTTNKRIGSEPADGEKPSDYGDLPRGAPPRPPDGASPREWAAWFAVAKAAARRPVDAAEPEPPDAPAGPPDALAALLASGRATGVAWRDPEAPAGSGSSFLDTKGISPQVPGTIGETVVLVGPGRPVARIVALAQATAAFREAAAVEHDASAAAAPGASGRKWHKDRARGLRTRWARVLECGATREVVFACGGCHGTAAADGIPCDTRECERCRPARLATMRAKALARVRAAEVACAHEIARYGYTDARPLGPWAWRLITVTVPPAGIGADAADIRGAWAWTWRKIVEWCRIEGQEDTAPVCLSSVEITPGKDNHGHVHLHALVLSPFIPHALVRRHFGEAIADGRRSIPSRTREEIICQAAAAGTFPKWTAAACQTRRGIHGRPMARVLWPVVDIRGTAGDSGAAVVELCKYTIKGDLVTAAGDLPPETLAYVADAFCALLRTRIFASSRWIAAFVPGAPPVYAGRLCECCGLIGHYYSRTRARAPPPDYRPVVVPGGVATTPAF